MCSVSALECGLSSNQSVDKVYEYRGQAGHLPLLVELEPVFFKCSASLDKGWYGSVAALFTHTLVQRPLDTGRSPTVT